MIDPQAIQVVLEAIVSIPAAIDHVALAVAFVGVVLICRRK